MIKYRDRSQDADLMHFLDENIETIKGLKASDIDFFIHPCSIIDKASLADKNSNCKKDYLSRILNSWERNGQLASIFNYIAKKGRNRNIQKKTSKITYHITIHGMLAMYNTRKKQPTKQKN